jgi:hypothetical protein
MKSGITDQLSDYGLVKEVFYPWNYLKTSLSVLFFKCRAVRDGSVKLSETSVTNYQSTLRNVSEERKSHFHRDGSLTSPQPYHYRI